VISHKKESEVMEFAARGTESYLKRAARISQIHWMNRLSHKGNSVQQTVRATAWKQ